MLLNQVTVTQEIPLLENGDRLTRPEFERRYAAMPQVKKAELIEGIVYMPSPVRVRQHGRPHAHIKNFRLLMPLWGYIPKNSVFLPVMTRYKENFRIRTS